MPWRQSQAFCTKKIPHLRRGPHGPPVSPPAPQNRPATSVALAPWRGGRFCRTAAKRCCAASSTAIPSRYCCRASTTSRPSMTGIGIWGDRLLTEFARPALNRPHWPLWRRGIRGAAGGDQGSRSMPGQTRFDEVPARAEPPSTRPKTRAATPPSRPDAGARAGRRALRTAACLPHLRSSTTLNSKRNCTATFSGSVTTTRVSCG